MLPDIPFDESLVRIPINGHAALEGMLTVPGGVRGVVIFAHGERTPWITPRSDYVARTLQEHRIATLLFDLLTAEEELEERAAEQREFHVRVRIERLLRAV